MKNECAVREDLNPRAEIYRERLKEHILLGLPGFVIAFVFTGIIFFTEITPNMEGGITVQSSIITVMMAFGFGIVCTGIPYGWKLMNKFFGQWIVEGNLFVIGFLLAMKFTFAYLMGLIAYPVAAVNYFIRSRKTKCSVKIWTIITISTVVVACVLIGIFGTC